MRVITGTARGRRLKELQGMETRPTTDKVKESLFSIIQFDIEGRRVLDLFAGTGQLGIEALSRGAAEAVFVDRRPDAVRLVQENLALCGFTDRARVKSGDALAYLKSGEKFDLIFLDPPYAADLLEQALTAIASFDICREHGIIVAESAADLSDLAGASGALSPVSGIPLRKDQTVGVSPQRKRGRDHMKTAIYPGSFDPITLGHLDIIRRSAPCFDRLFVCVMVNCDKKPMFSPEQRLELIRRSVADLPNVEAELYSGLLADYARQKGAGILVKGVRNTTDFDLEYQQAAINRGICPELETLLLPASPAYQHFSSTMVREMIRYGQPLEKYVPAPVAEELKGR